MEYMGVHFDVAANKGVRGQDKVLSTADSKVIVMSITTDEELVIATESSEISYYFYIEKERSASQIVLFLYTFSHHA